MNIFSYIVGAGFGGYWMVDLAKALIEGICSCCATVIKALNIDPASCTDGTVKSTISAAATTIATLLVVIELCTQAMGFHFDDINDAVRFGFKVVVYKIIIENSSKIVDLVYGIFVDSDAWTNIATSVEGLSGVFDTGDLTESKFNLIGVVGEILGIKQFFIGLILLLISIVVCGVLIKIMAAIAGLLFELAINIAIAPIPIATLVNSQTRGIGIGFIKNFAGNCMTLMMYTVCFTVYSNIKDEIQTAFAELVPSNDDFLLISGLVGSLISIILLSVAIKNVSTMINKILS